VLIDRVARRIAHIASEKKTRRNDDITAPQVRVVGARGADRCHGHPEALAGRGEPDWIWWRSPQAEPPVCRIMDYGKFIFEDSKKAPGAKKKQKQIQVKEVKFRPGTDEGDYQVKLRNLRSLHRPRRQGQGDAALSRPRNGAPGTGRAMLKRVESRYGRRNYRGAVSRAWKVGRW
jgi:hypothetical protein